MVHWARCFALRQDEDMLSTRAAAASPNVIFAVLARMASGSRPFAKCRRASDARLRAWENGTSRAEPSPIFPAANQLDRRRDNLTSPTRTHSSQVRGTYTINRQGSSLFGMRDASLIAIFVAIALVSNHYLW